jgi:quinol monooxygenase YgiN
MKFLPLALMIMTMLSSLEIKAESATKPLVRIAELEIDPVQLEAYTRAVTEEISTSIRVEPGVLAIYSVAIKNQPNHLRFFEIYADEAAYQAHIASTHFQKYVVTTKQMIVSRKLFETVPLALGAKPGSPIAGRD